MYAPTSQERARAATLVKMHEQYLYQCLTGRKTPPADRCPAIERALDGRVTCEDLRPDVRWHRVPDETWPHPQGRPLIDAAQPVQGA